MRSKLRLHYMFLFQFNQTRLKGSIYSSNLLHYAKQFNYDSAKCPITNRSVKIINRGPNIIASIHFNNIVFEWYLLIRYSLFNRMMKHKIFWVRKMYGLLKILMGLPMILISEVIAHKELVYTKVVYHHGSFL